MSERRPPVLFGEVLFDCFEDGSRVLGGAPFNVAWHLQAFGAEPLLVSRVGDDPPGRQVSEAMQQWGMSTAGLQLDPVHATGEVAVTLQQGQPRFEIVANRAWDHIDAAALPKVTPALIYHGSLALREATSARALRQLLVHRSPIFVDVNLRDPWWTPQLIAERLAQADWVKLNDIELQLLVGSAEDLLTLARALQKHHSIATLIVTRGSEGAFALDPHGNVVDAGPVPETTVVDTVGAGDGFAAICLLGLLYDWPLALTLARAQQFAAHLVAQRGATSDDPSLYQMLRSAWQLSKEA